MGKKSIQIEEELHSEIAEFCKLNGIKLGDFCGAALKNWLSIQKFGDAPFFVNSHLRSAEEPKEEKEEEKPIVVTVPLTVTSENSPYVIPKEVIEKHLDDVIKQDGTIGEISHPTEERTAEIETKPRKRRL